MAPTTTIMSKQLQCLQQRGPFQVVDVPTPRDLASNNVLIHQRVVALNPVDTKRRDTGIRVQTWPTVLGIEGGGVVEAVGDDVRDFKIGDEVVGWQQHALQERVVVPAHLLMKAPRGLGLEEAVSLPVAFVTAVSLIASLDIPLPILPSLANQGSPPSSVLVLGGASAVGANVIQLLRLCYPSLNIMATASTKNHAHVTGMGASKVLDYQSSTLGRDIKSGSPNQAGVDVILDCVAAGARAPDIGEAFEKTGSKRYSSLMTGSERFPLPEGVTRIYATAATLHGGQEILGLLPSLGRLLEEGKYKLPVPVKIVAHGLDAVPDVLDDVLRASCQKHVVKL